MSKLYTLANKPRLCYLVSIGHCGLSKFLLNSKGLEIPSVHVLLKGLPL